MFDLRGFSIFKNALSQDEVAQINGWIDARADELESTEPGLDIDGLPIQSYYSSGTRTDPASGRSIDDGINVQHVFEVEGWGEGLIDHPSWFGRVEHYLGSFTPFIHELFINIRGRAALSAATLAVPASTRTATSSRRGGARRSTRTRTRTTTSTLARAATAGTKSPGESRTSR